MRMQASNIDGFPPWMKLAAADVGVRELPGSATHPRIAAYYGHTRLGGDPEDGSTPWCSAALCCWMEEAGYMSTRRANARSWLGWGEALTEPRIGCVVVFSRGDPSGHQGHVALYAGPGAPGSITVLGGNQRNSVSYQLYDKARVLAYRWPRHVDKLTA